MQEKVAFYHAAYFSLHYLCSLHQSLAKLIYFLEVS